jgi:integrase
MIDMTRRKKGDGALFKTIHNNREEWCYCWTQNGKRHRVYGLSDTDALKKKNVFITKHTAAQDSTATEGPKRTTVGTKANPTVAQFMERWLSNRTKLTTQVRTQYRANITNHVLPVIGGKAVRKLTDTDIIAVMEEMKKKEAGETAIAHTMKQVNTMLRYAVKVKALRQNPCDYVDLPVVRPLVKATDSTTIEWRTSTALNILYDLKQPENPHHDAYSRIMLMFLGLRGAELVGLTWDCLNLHDKTLTIRQQMKKEVGGDYFIFNRTKNRKAREIPLFGSFLEAIVMEMEKSRKQTKPIKDENGKELTNLMWVNAKGKYITYKRHWEEWNEIQKAYFASEGNEEKWKDLRWRPHYNRHICASLLAKEHVPLITAQQILGHLDKEMTEYYTHAYRSDVEAGAQALSAAFSKDPWAFAKK